MGAIAAGIGAGAGLLQAGLGFGAASAQRAWEERMANTQYQRGVADMRKAGLNPALMFGSGGPAPTPNVPIAPTGNVGDAVSSAVQLVMIKKQMALLDQQAEQARANALKTNTENTIESVQNLEDQLPPGTVKTLARTTAEAARDNLLSQVNRNRASAKLMTVETPAATVTGSKIGGFLRMIGGNNPASSALRLLEMAQ